MGIVTIIQLNSQNFRQAKFKDESAKRTSVREHRRVLQNCLYQAL
ncbi:palindromic element RPE3 domain-containing protein [Rickettsia felis]|nr:palindromic element RPE3 domain-containing protein [Rickettsia felis]MDE8611014.1 palindromic element RPE3 domain-containing protein [Rickettsia felis]